ncbi:MAG: PIN domain-containing protein [Sphingomicrobium sp.]|nr:PIN domain-containing protein [Sphingomonadales bacterium]
MSQTIDTNVMVYALTEGHKAERARVVVATASFVSVQLLNELVNVARKKLRLDWSAAGLLSNKVREAVGAVLPISESDHVEALRLGARYRLSYYDALMLAVAITGGAHTIYSEDMQHDLVIDDTLRITDPFR